jgi:hypothetical protein
MTQEANTPNLYQLSSDELVISYTTSNSNGQPQLDYQGPRGTLSFTGNDVRIEQTTLGTLITVFLVRTVDTGSVTFTLLVPGVNLAGTGEQPIQTIAIETNNLFNILERNTARQTQTYQVYNLIGAADYTSA